jgi:GTP-binding protein
MHKERLIAVTKADMLDDELMDAIKKEYKDLNFIFISSHTGYHLKELKDQLWKMLNA